MLHSSACRLISSIGKVIQPQKVFKRNFYCERSLQRQISGAESISSTMASLDSLQVELLNEPCIVVDENDHPIRMETKQACHLINKDSKSLLHRAFSVFLFDWDGNLLVQQRSMAKITFPGYYTNTCCSHPLYTPLEMETKNAMGVKRAAQRRLEIELGIQKEQIPLENFHYITRIHYCSAYDDIWAEHEIDYILFIKANVTINENPNEVKNYCYISQGKLSSFLASLEKQNIPITPWFRLIVDNFLSHWLANLSNIESIQDQDTIHRL